MALNFADIANKKVEEVERPPLPPVGTYKFVITKIPEVSEVNSSKGSWDVLTISCRALEALDDVELDDYKGDIRNISQQVKFMFDKNDEANFERSEWRMRQFFEKHVQCVEAGATVAQMLNASVNGQFLGTIGWRPDPNDDENFFAEIKRTAPVE